MVGKRTKKKVSHIQNILFGKDTFIAICLVSITRLVGFRNYLTSQEVRNSDWFSLGISFSWSQNRQLGLTQIHWVWCLGFFFFCAIHHKINILLSFRTRKIPNIQSWYGKWKQFPTVGRQNMSLVTEIHLFWFPVVKVFLVLQKIETHNQEKRLAYLF